MSQLLIMTHRLTCRFGTHIMETCDNIISINLKPNEVIIVVAVLDHAWSFSCREIYDKMTIFTYTVM